MPRKRRVKDSPATEPTLVSEILPQTPIGRILEAHEDKSRVETDQPLPDPGAEAVAAFRRQREREQAVTELPPPDREIVTMPDRPVLRPKNWAETVRPWTSHGPDTGVHHVTAKIPVGDHGVMDVVGIKFAKGKHRTDEEKREMETVGLSFRKDLGAWIKPNRAGAFDETQDLARAIAERRRQAAAELER